MVWFWSRYSSKKLQPSNFRIFILLASKLVKNSSILVEKEFVGIQNPNRNNFYHPLVSKSAYSGKRIEGLTENYFEGSYANVVSFLVDKKQMSIEDLELLLQQLKNKRHD